MQNKIWEKIVATMLVIALTVGNLILIGSNMVAFAGENLEAQTEKTQHENVEFGAYFKSEEQKVHSLICDAKEKEKLYIHLNVKQAGYLKSGKIEIIGANYEIGELETSEIIGFKENNCFMLKQISYGTEATLEIPIKLSVANKFNIANIQKDSSVVLTGTYVTSNGTEVEINKSVTLNVAWKEQAEIKAKSEIKTYKTYNNDGETGIIIQEKIVVEKTKGILPVNKTNLEIDAKKYAGELPTKVYVSSARTEMTNGNVYENVEINYSYNNENGKINIEVVNKETDGEVHSKQGGIDEYVVTYEYSNEAYTAKQDEENVVTKINVIVENYTSSDNKQAKANINETKTLSSEFGNLVNGEVSIIEEINKAKMYANYNSTNLEYETPYTVKELVNIVKPNLVNEIIVQSNPESFIKKDGESKNTRIENVDYTYFRATKIAEENFKKILGEDGSLVVTNEAGKEIGKIDSTVEAKNGIYEINYTSKVGKIIITTSKPKVEGSLILEHGKLIKANLAYEKDEVLNFDKISAVTNVGTRTDTQEVECKQNLLEPLSNINIQSNKESINKTEENIELRVELGNNNENSVLYSNPTVNITFPNFVEDVEIVNSNLLFETELTLGKKQVVTGENGEKILEIKLNGTQTRFSKLEDGATLVLGVKVVSKQESGKGEIIAKVENSVATAQLTSYLVAEEKNGILLGTQGNGQTEVNTESVGTQEVNERIGINVTTVSSKVEENGTIIYIMYVSDITNYEEFVSSESNPYEIKNIQIKDFLPSGVTYKSASLEKLNSETGKEEEVTGAVQFDVKNRVVTWSLDELEQEESVTLTLEVTADILNQGVYDKEISNSATATYNGSNSATSNIAKVRVVKPHVNITKTSENVNNVNKEGDVVKFILTGKNVGGMTAKNFATSMELPEEIEAISIRYGINEDIHKVSRSDNNILPFEINLEPNSTYLFEVEAKIKDLPKNYTEQFKEVTVKATMYGEEISWNVKIENSNWNEENTENPSNPSNPTEPTNPNNPTEPTTPDQPSVTGKYTIKGTAWIDENKNGIKEEGESLLEHIKVKLLKDNAVLKETTTNEEGIYSFGNIAKGEYQISFEYNEALYKVTEYRKTGKLEVNSDAIETKAGEAITDIVKVVDSDVQHINLGLIKIQTFDMSLSKIVNKIIVQNSQGTKEYTYGNDYAKLDINGKYLNGTVVLVEYKMIIKNEGELAGKVKKIVDYVPRDMTFSTEMNNTWVQDSDGNLYNTELKSLEIEPGETKEITLILRKKMTEDNTGIINNTAEIAESENAENIKDKDSTPNNKVQGEDDMSSANVLIGVRTGEEVIQITLGLVVLIILAVGIYLINKEVLKK